MFASSLFVIKSPNPYSSKLKHIEDLQIRGKSHDVNKDKPEKNLR